MNQYCDKDLSNGKSIIKKEIKTKRYVVYGDPGALSSNKPAHDTVWDSVKATRLKARIDLENQQENLPLFSGPLILSAMLFMPTRYKRFENKYHDARPSLEMLLRFIESIGQGIIYTGNICKITATKIYSFNPRIEFILQELKDE